MRGAQVRRIERLSDQHLVHLALDDSEHELVSAAPTGAELRTRRRGARRAAAAACGSTPTASVCPAEPPPNEDFSHDQAQLIRSATQTLIDHVDELTALDQAIGDGDHGLNMRRGALAIQAKLRRTGRPVAQRRAASTMGMTCMSTIGGSSGPVFGTLMVTLAKELPAAPQAGRPGARAATPASRR